MGFLFDDIYDSDKLDWEDMPEFLQNKVDVYKKITIRFDSEEHVKEFSELIKQNIGKNTKSIWFPKLKAGLFSKMRYVDEDALEESKA